MTIKSGLLPTKPDHRDYDFHKSFGTALPPTFPANYDTDAHLWMPDQDAGSDKFSPPVPPLPYGCTDYTQSDLCADEDGALRNPMLLENVTHANAKNGIDNRPRRPLSRGFGPLSCPNEPLVSYQINRLLSGWNLPPLVIRAVGAHCIIQASPDRKRWNEVLVCRLFEGGTTIEEPRHG